ncbi:MAG: methyltransferase domain-containing protein [Candidatus Viridilinea halotolerans]|uniref:Methyltransferase domain-containing protein n=1 Tax=Candidatus Viridilinea halotolerans TaxID=2491704 RepID=A0A426U0B5_9CHLR|nr:MAG: methyltransferase domain-containing protein [Candidatus Viridilinea halotolerans]
MDTTTLTTYDQQAATFAAAQRGKTPEALQRLILAYFRPGAPTADIGCGSGRDTAWLVANGFPAVGYDGSTGMLSEAQRAFPALTFQHATLPDLATIPPGQYQNVLCSAVIMHLPAASIPSAIANLARIMAPAGRLLLTYRASAAEGAREADGRLYSPITSAELAAYCKTTGLQVQHQASSADGGRPGVVWHVLVAGL